MTGLRFVKGHGTENDFVLLTADAPELDQRLAAAVCDRRRGVGADGVLRVVPTGDPTVPYFMDYRNADGSVAEMCGNGVRVFARYLVASGCVAPGRLRVATRDGVKQVTVPAEGDVTVSMGVATPLPAATVTVGGVPREGVGVSLGNPHVVVRVGDPAEAGPLLDPPALDPAGAYPEGANVEFVAVLGPGRLSMRVYERGVGETRSCGTGACAAAVAAAGWSVPWPERVSVEVAGGTLVIGKDETGEGLTLTGPAVLVGEGVLRPEWVAATLGAS